MIYGFSAVGCGLLTLILNLMAPSVESGGSGTGIDVWLTASVLGYCLLPVIGLAVVNIVFNLRCVRSNCRIFYASI